MNGISVIVPVFNGAHLLPSCVQCIQRAGRRVGEIILVDDGSTDETYSRALALAESDGRVRVIHTDNHGTYEARKTGVAAASCPYIAFADADDRFCTGALDLLAELLEGHGADISFGGILTVFAPDSPAPPAVCGEVRALSPAEMWPRLMRWGTQEFNLYVWNKLYNRELLENLIEADDVCQGEDVLLSCQAFLRAGRIVETTAPVYCYFQNPDASDVAGKAGLAAGLTGKGRVEGDGHEASFGHVLRIQAAGLLLHGSAHGIFSIRFAGDQQQGCQGKGEKLFHLPFVFAKVGSRGNSLLPIFVQYLPKSQILGKIKENFYLYKRYEEHSLRFRPQCVRPLSGCARPASAGECHPL